MRRFVLRSSSSYSCNNLLAFSNEDVCAVSSFESQSSFTLSIFEFLSDASNLVSEAFSISCKFQYHSSGLAKGFEQDGDHPDSGTKMLKAQHPDYETWSTSVHADASVTCVDCHMP